MWSIIELGHGSPTVTDGVFRIEDPGHVWTMTKSDGIYVTVDVKTGLPDTFGPDYRLLGACVAGR